MSSARARNIVYALDRRTGRRARGGRWWSGGGGAGGGRRCAGRRRATRATGLYRSDDGGATWRLVSAGNPRPMYFSQVRIDPNSSDRIYMGGVGM